jgi:hypothetical protein
MSCVIPRPYRCGKKSCNERIEVVSFRKGSDECSRKDEERLTDDEIHFSCPFRFEPVESEVHQ